MKVINYFFTVFATLLVSSTNAQVAINSDGSAPRTSAMLDVVSTTGGFMAPTMTQVQRNAIASPLSGLLIYQTDNTPGFYYYNGSGWIFVNGGTVSIANGGTGSTTQNFVDLTTTQAVGGAKTWSSLGTFSLGINSTGAAVNLNASSNNATNINTGTSTGAVNIANGTTGGNAIAIGNNLLATGIIQRVGTGNFSLDGAGGSTYTIGTSTIAGTITIGGTAQTGNITLGSSTAAQSVLIGNGVNAGAQIVSIANGATAANSTVNILSGVGTAGAGTLSMGNNTRVATIDIGNIAPAAARTTTIAGGGSAFVDLINIGTGNTSVAGGKTIHIGDGTPTGTNLITMGSIAAVASTTTIQGGSGATAISLTPNAAGGIVIGAAAGTGNITLGSSTAAQSVLIGNGVNAGAQIVSIANGATAANSTVNILSGVGTAGAGTLNIGNNTRVSTINLGNIAPAAARTTTIAGGGSAVVDLVNIGTGAATVAGGKTINIGTTAPTGAGTNKITIGAAGTTNGMGLRLGNGRLTVNKPTVPTTGLNGAHTMTVTEILDAGIIGFASNAARNLTFPTAQGATGLVQALPGTPAVGDVFTFEVFNTGTGVITLVTGTGVTIVNPTITATGTRDVKCRVTGVTAGAETISVY